jgi:hypothetical protein
MTCDMIFHIKTHVPNGGYEFPHQLAPLIPSTNQMRLGLKIKFPSEFPPSTPTANSYASFYSVANTPLSISLFHHCGAFGFKDDKQHRPINMERESSLAYISFYFFPRGFKTNTPSCLMLLTMHVHSSL